jgi:hypothetical protein|tara:strand:- start:148 stop:249 length:102 start_codon:yes stop_codon:yes gene_type:complete
MDKVQWSIIGPGDIANNFADGLLIKFKLVFLIL